jgi:hypothetical protein
MGANDPAHGKVRVADYTTATPSRACLFQWKLMISQHKPIFSVVIQGIADQAIRQLNDRPISPRYRI